MNIKSIHVKIKLNFWLKKLSRKIWSWKYQKIKELLDYIKNIIRYNITTAKTLFNHVKKNKKIILIKK